jgi:hypothetical protein
MLCATRQFIRSRSRDHRRTIQVVNVAAGYADYSAEAAEWAFALLLDVLEACAANPKPLTAEWASCCATSR